MLTGKLFFNLLISAILGGFSLLLLVLESFKFFFKPVTKFIYFIHENELVDRHNSVGFHLLCTYMYVQGYSTLFIYMYYPMFLQVTISIRTFFLHHFYVFQELFYGLSFFTKRLLHDCFPIWRIGPNLLQINWKQMGSKTSAGTNIIIQCLNICDCYSKIRIQIFVDIIYKVLSMFDYIFQCDCMCRLLKQVSSMFILNL